MNQASLAALRQLPVPMAASDFSALDERKVQESAFHDEWRAEGGTGESAGNVRFYEAATPVKEYIGAWFNRYVPGQAFLDYACGDGSLALRAAAAGAAFALGIDISLGSVEGANRRAQALGYAEDKVRFLQRDCEDTQLPAGSFGAAICSGMLHHLDLDRAFPELFRIMAPGGRIICNEPLAYNPAIQAYRQRTPALRTEWEAEHILTMEDLRRAERAGFRLENVRFWFLLSPIGALLPAGPLRRAAISFLHFIERPLCMIPGLKWWSWQLSFELVKPDR
jgi:SAM-dependent methyltransferase